MILYSDMSLQLRQRLQSFMEQHVYPAETVYAEQLNQAQNWNFYLVFSYFRFTAILQGVLKRAVEGNASSKKAFTYDALAPVLANNAVKLID